MQAAVLDSCVLYPAALRDFFMRLAVKLYPPNKFLILHYFPLNSHTSLISHTVVQFEGEKVFRGNLP
jgi:hypothetical protein